jgi:hypothetical protein
MFTLAEKVPLPGVAGCIIFIEALDESDVGVGLGVRVAHGGNILAEAVVSDMV